MLRALPSQFLLFHLEQSAHLRVEQHYILSSEAADEIFGSAMLFSQFNTRNLHIVDITMKLLQPVQNLVISKIH